MAASGLVVAGKAGARDRRPYAVTDAGRAAFASWLGRTPGEETIRFPLLLTLAFAAHLPAGELAAMLTTHRQVHATRLEGYLGQRDAALAAGARPVDLVTLDFGIRYERAVLEWFAHLPPGLPVEGASAEEAEV